jgi:hypothetical protein
VAVRSTFTQYRIENSGSVGTSAIKVVTVSMLSLPEWKLVAKPSSFTDRKLTSLNHRLLFRTGM